MATLLMAGQAWAKASIAEANITGPGLDGGMRIDPPNTEGLWETGIDVVGGLDDARSDSLEELGLTHAGLGPRYLVTYRFEFSDELIRQDLYPYAKSGPVTFTHPDQELTVGVKMRITAGWYQSPTDLFQYLVDHGLPETDPVAPVATGEGADTASRAQTAPWAGIMLVLVGLTLSLAALALRRRGVAGAR
jgi:hypothetical protein